MHLRCGQHRGPDSGGVPEDIQGLRALDLRLYRRLEHENIKPKESSIIRLVAGGESFADESRAYLAETWGCPVYNTYGSTEGTMCGECSELAGLHVPEDLVHLDIYDPEMKAFVYDGNCGRGVLTTLLPVGSRAGTLLLNYDTEDIISIKSQSPCACGRTHMRIVNPQREAETVRVFGNSINRVDVEAGVFQHENMQFLNGEYEAFISGSESQNGIVMKVRVETTDLDFRNRRLIEDRFVERFLKHRRDLAQRYTDRQFNIVFDFVGAGELELHRLKGRPKRLIDRRDA
jgi:phenylacetate-coenzyme A ligase PaaK-like adenylate-forming protein